MTLRTVSLHSFRPEWCDRKKVLSASLAVDMHVICVHFTLHYIKIVKLHSIPLDYITLHYARLHYITLHYIALHYIALHYIALHYIHKYSMANSLQKSCCSKWMQSRCFLQLVHSSGSPSPSLFGLPSSSIP